MKFKIINLLSVVAILILPYYLFEGKFFVGGDDTRLFYSYPVEFFKNATFFSWYNVSTIGINASNQYLIPFLILWSILLSIVQDRIVVSYFAFSLPLILGFIYFQKAVKELFNLGNNNIPHIYIGSLFYILSPIMLANQLFVYLTSAWMIGYIPMIGYYFLRYLKTSRFIYVYISMLITIALSFTLMTIPWILGFVIPILIGLIVFGLLSSKKEILHFIKRALLFLIVILSSQAFWLAGFITPYIFVDKNSLANKFVSKEFLDTFDPTILVTATGSILYPLLNLYHRQIAFDFGWHLKNIFVSTYDKTYLLNFLFVVVIFIGILNYRKYLEKKNAKIFIFVLTSFTVSLYLFTVNIGPLKEFFLLLKYIPGVVMFRNFYDKFAPGYVIIYALLFTICLIIVDKKFKSKTTILMILCFALIIFNFSPAKDIINSPLWTTKSTYKTISTPFEYLEFMGKIEDKISPTNSILSIPFGTSSYTVIKDESTDSVFVGASPVKIFSGVNDISGHLSFNFTKETGVVDSLIIGGEYEKFMQILHEHNINYLLLTRNVPEEVKRSYVFEKKLLDGQNAEFLDALTDRELFRSSKNNYILYSIKNPNKLLVSKNLYFQKINNTKYKMYIKNLKSPQILEFNDTFNIDWNIYMQKNPNLDFCVPLGKKIEKTQECNPKFSYVQKEDLSYLWKPSSFDNTHSTLNGFANQWKIDPNDIRENLSPDYYKVNPDGSIDVQFVLYFKPQSYFYMGAIISLLVIVASTMSLIIITKRKGNDT